MNKNLLIALFPPPQVRERLQAYRGLCRWPDPVRLADPRRMHLTIYHLGEVAQARIAPLLELLATHPMERADLLVRIPRSAAPIHELRVRVPRAYRRFRQDLGASLSAAGFRLAGGNSPHITLCYRADAAPPAVPVADIPWVAGDYHLIWSDLPAGGRPGRHHVLRQFPAILPAQSRLFD